MTPDQIHILGDLIYIARTQTPSLSADISNRLLALRDALANKTVWTDADRALILGYVAATGDGAYPMNRVVIDIYAKEIGTTVRLPSQPVPVPQPAQPSSSEGTIPGLTADQIKGVIAAIDAGPSSWIPEKARIKRELSATPPIYTYGDPSINEAMRELVDYQHGTPAAVIAYLHIIDQRDNGKVMTYPGPLWKLVDGTPSVNTGDANGPTAPAPITGDLAQQVIAILRSLGLDVRDGQLARVRLSSKTTNINDTGEEEGWHWVWFASDDGALREDSGWAPTGQPVPNDVYGNPKLPKLFRGFERDGASFVKYYPKTANGPTPFPRRKSESVYYGGWVRGRGPHPLVGPFVDYCYLEGGRGPRWSRLQPRTGDPNQPIDVDGMFALDGDPNQPDAGIIRVGNQMRRIVLGADGKTLEAGEVVDENQ